MCVIQELSSFEAFELEFSRKLCYSEFCLDWKGLKVSPVNPGYPLICVSLMTEQFPSIWEEIW